MRGLPERSRVRSGMEINDIMKKVADRCVEKGATVHSRQITALAEILVEEIALIEGRVDRIESVWEALVNRDPAITLNAVQTDALLEFLTKEGAAHAAARTAYEARLTALEKTVVKLANAEPITREDLRRTLECVSARPADGDS